MISATKSKNTGWVRVGLAGDGEPGCNLKHREDLAENVASESRPERGSGTSHVQILAKSCGQCPNTDSQCRPGRAGRGPQSFPS